MELLRLSLQSYTNILIFQFFFEAYIRRYEKDPNETHTQNKISIRIYISHDYSPNS